MAAHNNMTKFSLSDNDDLIKVGETRHIAEKYGTILSKEYRIKHRCAKMVLLYLQATVIKHVKGDNLGLYNRFYRQGYLVSTKSLWDLSKAFGYNSIAQMKRMVKQLVADGEMYIAKVDVGKNKPQNVYVVGIHNTRLGRDYEDLYFTELKYNPKLKEDLKYYFRLLDVDEKIINLAF